MIARIRISEGERYESLVVMERVPAAPKSGQPIKWLCGCDCGETTTVSSSNLASGSVKSCGCRRKTSNSLKAKHGHASGGVISPTYITWTSMKSRCEDEKNPNYQKYGAVGITICEAWRDFSNFLRDMGERPTKAHSIDRIDNSLGYEKENCRWATKREQTLNRRQTLWIELDGAKVPLVIAAERFGIKPDTLRYRIRAGLDPLTACTAPVNRTPYNTRGL